MSQSLKLLKQLENASGQTQLVLALIFDIRGFTNFCKSEGDSFNIANFVRRVYISVLSNYFQDAAYYKPTGDGMLVIFSCSAGKESEITNNVVERSVKLVNEFPTLCKGDKLVYFKTPSNIGIGISRGSACCISSEGEIVDYSGKPLNLAARLSDMARPLGVVFDESVSSCIPAENLDKNFLNENVYVKGLAEEEPIKVYHTKDTIIPSAYKKPINEPEWKTDSSTFTFQEISSWDSEGYERYLSKIPLDASKIILEICFNERKTKERTLRICYNFQMNENPKIYYQKIGNSHSVTVNIAYIRELLQSCKLQPTDEVKFELTYPVKT